MPTAGGLPKIKNRNSQSYRCGTRPSRPRVVASTATWRTTGRESAMTGTAERALQGPTLSEQVTRLYDIIAGYHATNLLAVAEELGVWRAITAEPGITSDGLATKLGTEPLYTDVLCRTAFAFELLERAGTGWRMATHFDQILGDPDATFYLGRAAEVHMVVGQDYQDYPAHFRNRTRSSYQAHDARFMESVAGSTTALPRIFVDFVLPQLPALAEQLESSGRLLDLGCGGGWAVVQLAERFPALSCTGLDIEPYSVELARRLIGERGLASRCEARVGSAELAEPETYDVVTSFLVVHEIDPPLKKKAFADVARALRPGGAFLIFDEAYPEDDEALRQMPQRFAALAQWYELTLGNRVNTRSELLQLCQQAGFEVIDETGFSRFHIIVARKP